MLIIHLVDIMIYSIMFEIKLKIIITISRHPLAAYIFKGIEVAISKWHLHLPFIISLLRIHIYADIYAYIHIHIPYMCIYISCICLHFIYIFYICIYRYMYILYIYIYLSLSLSLSEVEIIEPVIWVKQEDTVKWNKAGTKRIILGISTRMEIKTSIA